MQLSTRTVLRGAFITTLVVLLALLTANGGFAQSCAPQLPGLVSWWPGDGNARDIRGGVDGTLRNGATFAAGEVGEAFSFTLSNDFVETGSKTWGFSTSATVTAWIKTTADGPVFSLAHGAIQDEMLLLVASGKIGIYNHKSSFNFVALQSDSSVNTGGWVLVAGVLDGGGSAGLKIFVNGVQETGTPLTSGSPTDIVDTTPRNVRIGWRNTENASEHFTGLIDEVELFNRALSATEIKAIYDAGPAGTCKLAHFACYKAALAKGQPKFSATSRTLTDQLGSGLFDVKAIASICNPADKNDEGITFSDVHEEGFKIAAHKGEPKFVKSNHTTVDQFGTLSLTITGPATLLDVTPKALGATPPAQFSSDPTSDASVNRFKCYKASITKGTPKFVPPPDPTVTDEFFPSGQAFHLTKVTKLCTPVDKEGETPGADGRASHLVCYQAALPKGTPKFTPTTVSTNSTNFGHHVLVVKGVAELCVPAIKDPA